MEPTNSFCSLPSQAFCHTTDHCSQPPTILSESCSKFSTIDLDKLKKVPEVLNLPYTIQKTASIASYIEKTNSQNWKEISKSHTFQERIRKSIFKEVKSYVSAFLRAYKAFTSLEMYQDTDKAFLNPHLLEELKQKNNLLDKALFIKDYFEDIQQKFSQEQLKPFHQAILIESVTHHKFVCKGFVPITSCPKKSLDWLQLIINKAPNCLSSSLIEGIIKGSILAHIPYYYTDRTCESPLIKIKLPVKDLATRTILFQQLLALQENATDNPLNGRSLYCFDLLTIAIQTGKLELFKRAVELINKGHPQLNIKRILVSPYNDFLKYAIESGSIDLVRYILSFYFAARKYAYRDSIEEADNHYRDSLFPEFKNISQLLRQHNEKLYASTVIKSTILPYTSLEDCSSSSQQSETNSPLPSQSQYLLESEGLELLIASRDEDSLIQHLHWIKQKKPDIITPRHLKLAQDLNLAVGVLLLLQNCLKISYNVDALVDEINKIQL